MTDVLCVDVAVQEDLMLHDQLARGVVALSGQGRRLLILLGSGEAEERRLETAGHVPVRREGALERITPPVESSMRESVRTLSNRLTDEGAFAVGMMATDRNIAVQAEDGLRISAQRASQLWTGPGVVPVLGSLVGNGTGGAVDVHPLALAVALEPHLGSPARIILLLKHAVGPRADLTDEKNTVSKEKLMEEGLFVPGLSLPVDGISWYVGSPLEASRGQVVQVL